MPADPKDAKNVAHARRVATVILRVIKYLIVLILTTLLAGWSLLKGLAPLSGDHLKSSHNCQVFLLYLL